MKSLEAQEVEGDQRHQELAREKSDLDAREEELKSRTDTINSALDESRQKRDFANTALTEAKVNLASEEQLCGSFKTQLKPLELRIEELAHLIEQRRDEMSSYFDRKGQAEKDIHDSRQKIDALTQERNVVNAQTAALTEQRQTYLNQISERENSLRQSRVRHDEIQQSQTALEVELAERRLKVENLKAKIQEKISNQLGGHSERMHYHNFCR